MAFESNESALPQVILQSFTAPALFRRPTGGNPITVVVNWTPSLTK